MRPNTWSILKNTARALEKNVYSTTVECSIDVYYVQLVYSVVQALYILTDLLLNVLSITASGVLMSPTTIAELSISPFSSAYVCLIYFGILLFCAYPYVLLRKIFLLHSKYLVKTKKTYSTY